MEGTYYTDITHFLNDNGEIASEIAKDGRSLASFLIIIIDKISEERPSTFVDTGIRCRKPDCEGNISAFVNMETREIVWECVVCGHNGVISNWVGTKWDEGRFCGIEENIDVPDSQNDMEDDMTCNYEEYVVESGKIKVENEHV